MTIPKPITSIVTAAGTIGTARWEKRGMARLGTNDDGDKPVLTAGTPLPY